MDANRLEPHASGQASRPEEINGTVGIFTQTVLPSPVIQWILPARLRSKHHNDVVFVGQQRIQIKEAALGGYLEDVIEKTDFGGSIIQAKALNVSTQLPWESELRTDGIVGGQGVDPDVLDDLPAQILVVTLDLKQILFLCCSRTQNTFITFCRPLPVNVSLPEKFGRHVAVDPKSRVVATSASDNYFALFVLKSPREIQLQLAQDNLDPIKTEKFCQCEGHILFMEFLYPKSMNDKKIILLIVAARKGSTYASIYEWNEDIDLKNTAPDHFEFKLNKMDRNPTMVVPLTKESSFLIVTSANMSVYTPDNFSRPTKYPLIVANSELCEVPLWTRWARPARNWLYNQRYDGIYLCREDGWIYYMEFGNEGELESTTSLGQLHCNVDRAFDVLDMGHEGGDFILAAGGMGDGGLFVQEARDHPRCVQRFLNWAPVTDAIMVHPETSHAPPRNDVSRDRVFVCSTGTSGPGAIHELRYGIEAPIGVTVPLEDLPGIRDMWAMNDNTNGGTYILMSEPMSSLLLYMNSDLEEGISALDEAETELDTAQTLAAGCTPEGILVQVTANATHLFAPSNLSLNRRIAHDKDITVVAVDVDGPNSAIATAIRRTNQLSVLYTRIVVSSDATHLEVGPSVDISSEPICLSLQRFGDMTFIFVGFGCGKVRAFQVEDGAITYLCEASVSVDSNDDISRAIDSLAAIRLNFDGTLHAFLLCGLRSGILAPFEIDFTGATLISLLPQIPKRIGTTSIRLQSNGPFALLICGSELWHASYPLDGLEKECTLERVWITDQNSPAYFPVTLNGFGLAAAKGSSSLGPLFCFADRQLLICDMHHEAKMVPRRIGLPGNALRLTYSNHLRSLIVSYSVTEVEDQSRPTWVKTRTFIDFVDPNSQQPVGHDSTSDMQKYVTGSKPHSACGETVNCILDWMFERDGHKYHLVVIGTTLGSRDGNPRGRVIMMHASRDSAHPFRISWETKFEKSFDGLRGGPVRAIAAFRDSLIVGSGKLLFPLTSKNADTRWSTNATRELPSPAVEITVCGTYIFVTTARHGFVIFEAVNGQLKSRKWDNLEHFGLSHYICPGVTPLVFMSSLGGGVQVAKLGRDPENWGPASFPAEVRLPGSVRRFLLDSTVELTPTTPWQRGASMYGITIDGTMYRFFLLRKKELQLLWLLQNMCCKDSDVCPSTPARERRVSPLWREPRSDNCRIDGDILARLARRDPDFLDNMIAGLDHGRETDFFARHFRQLTREVLGETSNDARHVIVWLRHLVRIAI